jgi:hypothetical protein
MQVLFATCHEDEPLEDLRSEAGNVLSFETTAAGSLTWSEASEHSNGSSRNGAVASNRNLKITIPKWCVFSMSSEPFQHSW